MPACELHIADIGDIAIPAAIKLQQNVITLTFLQNNTSDFF